jgi:hypothetical protein
MAALVVLAAPRQRMDRTAVALMYLVRVAHRILGALLAYKTAVVVVVWGGALHAH